MEKLYKKWNQEFQIDDIDKESIHFDILKDFLKEYYLLKKNRVLDHDNMIQINERVKEKTKGIETKLIEKERQITKLNQSRELAEERLEHLVITMDEQNKHHKNNIDNAVSINNESHRNETDVLKEQIVDLKQDKKDLKLQLELLNTISDQLKNKNESSFAKGVEGEDDLLTLLKDDGSFKVEDTHGQNHKGDALIRSNNRTYCIDSKNHTHNVPAEDVTKLINDVKLNDYDGGAIIAWKTHIYDPSTCARIREEVIIKKMAGKPILFISHAERLDKGMIISLLKMLEQHIGSKEDINNSINYDRLYQNVISLIEKEETSMESEYNSFMKRYNKRKKTLKTLKDNLSQPADMSDNIETKAAVTTITELINSIADKHDGNNGQRNSTRDIKHYFELYCSHNSHPLLDDIKNVVPKELNKILSSLGYKTDKKHGLNYDKKVRKKTQETWSLNLSPDILN